MNTSMGVHHTCSAANSAYTTQMNKTNHCFLFTNRQNPDISDIPIKVCKSCMNWLPLMLFSVNAAPEAHCCQDFLINAQCTLWFPAGSTNFTGLTVEVLVQYYPNYLNSNCVQREWRMYLHCKDFEFAHHVLHSCSSPMEL